MNSTTLITITKRTVLIIVSLVLLNISCRKNVTKLDKNYIGEWCEDDLTVQKTCLLSIVINPDGNAVSNSNSSTSDCRRYGTRKGVAKTDGSTLKIGLAVYDLVEPPTFIDSIRVRTDFGERFSKMRMKLNDMTLYKLTVK